MAARDGTRTPRWHLRWTRGSWYAPKESQAAMGPGLQLGPGPTGGGEKPWLILLIQHEVQKTPNTKYIIYRDLLFH